MAPLSYSSHSHCFDRSELAEFALGKLPASELERIAVEVETCPNCQALLETLDGLEDSVIVDLKGHAGPLPLDPQLNEQIQAAEEISRVVWGGSRASVPEERLPAHLGQYEIRERIGRGGMGTVYKAMHTRLKRPVAIKVLPAGRLRDPQAVARFQREMEAVGQLDHPNLVCAHDAGEAGGQHFLAMEFLDGIDLAHMVRQRGPLAVAVTCEVARQAALGLQYAHEHGLVHRDVKPSNIMLTATGIVKVLDLGLARVTADVTPIDDMTATGQIVGTGDFIAPEQGQDTRQADARSDVYALGCTLYFLLVGRAPFSGPEHSTFFKKVMAHANEAVPPIQRLRTDIPDGLAAVLGRMLAKEPSKRFQTAADVANALEPYAAGHALQGVLDGQGAVGVHKAAFGAKQRRRGFRLAVMLSLTVIVAALGYLYGDVALMVLRGEGLLVVTGQRDDVQLVASPVNGSDIKLELDKAGTVRLQAGEYDVRVTGGKTSVVIEPERVAIVRGGCAVVELRRQAGMGTIAAHGVNNKEEDKGSEACREAQKLGTKAAAIDGQSLAAEIVTTKRMEEDGTTLLKKAIGDYPLEFVDFTPSGKFSPGDKGGLDTTIRYSVNPDAYRKYVAGLGKVLKLQAEQSGSGAMPVDDACKLGYSDFPESTQKAIEMKAWGHNEGQRKSFLIIGKSIKSESIRDRFGRKASVDVVSADWYVIKGESASLPYKAWRKSAGLLLRCSLQDENGTSLAEVQSRPCRLGDRRENEMLVTPGGPVGTAFSDKTIDFVNPNGPASPYRQGIMVFLPRLLATGDPHIGSWHHLAETVEIPLHFDISTDEIAKVKKLVVVPELPAKD